MCWRLNLEIQSWIPHKSQITKNFISNNNGENKNGHELNAIPSFHFCLCSSNIKIIKFFPFDVKNWKFYPAGHKTEDEFLWPTIQWKYLHSILTLLVETPTEWEREKTESNIIVYFYVNGNFYVSFDIGFSCAFLHVDFLSFFLLSRQPFQLFLNIYFPYPIERVEMILKINWSHLKWNFLKF